MKTWFISDTHFSHANIIKYGERPYRSVAEMDFDLVNRWNDAVSSGDKVYHLGDVGGMTKTMMGLVVGALNGRKVLVKGNHDNLKLSAYAEYFYDIRATHLLGTGRNDVTHLVLSHVPLHPESIKRGWVNVHGHRHQRGSPPGPYVSVSVEMTGYRPLEMKEVAEMAARVVTA